MSESEPAQTQQAEHTARNTNLEQISDSLSTMVFALSAVSIWGGGTILGIVNIKHTGLTDYEAIGIYIGWLVSVALVSIVMYDLSKRIYAKRMLVLSFFME